MRTWMKRHGMKITGIATLGAVFALAAPVSAATSPAVPGGTAVVDGNLSEWADVPVFSDMHRAGKENKVVESTLKLQYDCSSRTLYVAVQTVPGVTIIPSNGDNFVKLGRNNKLVDGNSATFAYVVQNGQTIGWEASYQGLVPREYLDLNVHAQVDHGGSQTSAVPNRAIPMLLECGTTPPYEPALKAGIVANPEFDRAHTWTITKNAVVDQPNTTADTATAHYTVTATKSAPADTNFRILGTINILNPSLVTVTGIGVTVTRDGQPCTLTSAVPTSITSKGKADISFTCTLPAGTPTTAGSVSATVTSSAPAAVAQPDTYNFTDAEINLTGDAADVTDVFNGGDAEALANGTGITETTTFPYDREIAVPDTGCSAVPNTATVTPTDTSSAPNSADASVTVCREAIGVTVDSTTVFARAHTWAIAKSASYTAGDATASYSVSATKSAPVDSGHAVTGTITATNPTDATISGISATATVAGTPCTVESGTKSATANGGTATFTYTCEVDAATAGTVDATVSYGTPQANRTGSSDFTFGEPTTVTGNAIDVLDTFNNGTPVILENGAAITESTTFTYTRPVPMPAASTCHDIPNVVVGTAPGTTIPVTGEADASVHVCTPQIPPTTPETPPTTPETPQTPTTPQSPTSPQPQTPSTNVPVQVRVAGVAKGTARLSIIKVGPASAKAGSVITFSIRVRNTSKVAATRVVIRDILPAGYTVVRAPGATITRGRPVWNVGNLAPGATKTVTIRVRIGKNVSGSRINRATAVAANAAQVAARRTTKVARVAGAIVIPRVTG